VIIIGVLLYPLCARKQYPHGARSSDMTIEGISETNSRRKFLHSSDFVVPTMVWLEA
jgi:hypothetical protein